MAQTTANTAAFIEATQYSQFILQNLHDAFLPDAFYRNVTDFGNGTTLNIKTIGTAQIQDVEENTPLIYNPIDTGTVQLQITDFPGDAWYVTDVLREDGAQIEQLMALRAQESTRALQEYFETRFLATLNAGQTAANPNNINGLSRRRRATGTNQTLSQADFIDMKFAFDRAQVPYAGRIAIVDPVVEATLNKLVQITAGLDRNPVFQSAFDSGWAKEHKFIGNIFGWDVYVSNRLPDVAAGTSIDGTNAITNAGKANIFMCVADDSTKPGMMAWRRMPKVETDRDVDNQRDKFVTTARFGLGIQRVDTLGVVVCDAVATA